MKQELNQDEIQASLAVLRSVALKSIKLGYLDLAAQIMFIAETLERYDKNNLVELPHTVLEIRRDTAV